MLQSKTVLDARFKKLMALMLSTGDGGAINPLSRMAFIDAGNAGSQNGSIAEPFKTISAWTASIPAGATAAENLTPREGFVTPQVYAENVNLPAYRSTTLCGATAQTVTGNLVLANTVLAGGKNPPATMTVQIHNMSFTGNLTVTDDATAPLTAITLSQDEGESATIGGNVDVSGATHVGLVELTHAAIGGAFVSTATGPLLDMTHAEIVGNITASAVLAHDSSFLGAAMALGAFDSTFKGCDFTGVAVTGVAGTRLLLDGPSMASFAGSGSTAGVNVKILVDGGYAGCGYLGANLTNADVSVSLDGTGATAGFTQGGNHYILPAATLGAPHTLTLLTGGGERLGDVMRITRADATANAYTIHNNAGATIGTLVASVEAFFEARYNGVDWEMSAIS